MNRLGELQTIDHNYRERILSNFGIEVLLALTQRDRMRGGKSASLLLNLQSLLVTGFVANQLRLNIVPFAVFAPAVVHMSSMSSASAATVPNEVDREYPGTAVERLRNVHARVKSLTGEQLNGDWPSVRRNLLWAGGLKDLPNARPGEGYTGHSFNDYNHCDLTTMLGAVASNENEGKVAGNHSLFISPSPSTSPFSR